MWEKAQSSPTFSSSITMKIGRAFTWSKIRPMYRPRMPIMKSNSPQANQMEKIVVV